MKVKDTIVLFRLDIVEMLNLLNMICDMYETMGFCGTTIAILTTKRDQTTHLALVQRPIP